MVKNPRGVIVVFPQVTLLHIGSGEGWIDVTLNIIGAQGISRHALRATPARGLQVRPKTRVEQAIPVVIFMAPLQ